MFPFGESVQIEARVVGGEDSHGNPVETFSPAVTVEGCAFDPGGSVETMEPGREAVVSSPRIFAPSGTVVTRRSRVQVRGENYVVDGDPADWRNPFTGWMPGVVITLEKADG